MRRMILVEFTPAIGHQALYNNTYRLLKTGFEVICFCPKGYEKQGVDFKYNDLPKGYSKRTKNYLKHLWNEIVNTRANVKNIVQYARKNKISDIICLTYGDFGFCFSFWLIPKHTNLYLMHHANVDSISRSRIKTFMFNIYKKRFMHIVNSGFMGDYLKNCMGVDYSRVLVWPHPLNQITISQKELIYDCVGLSNSNDERIINQIIETERQTEIIKKNSLHIVLKSTCNKFDNGYLQVFNGFIDKARFDDFISKARCLFMPFPDSYQMRMSGTLMDALSNNKILLGTNIPIIKYSKKMYPNIVQIFDINTFIPIILDFKIKKPEFEKEFTLFKHNHSDAFLAPLMISSLTQDKQMNSPLQKYDF